MTWLDLLLIALLAASIYSGYRRGAVLQLMGIAGLSIGVVVGVMLAPRVAVLADSQPTAVAMVLGTALVAGAIGNMAGWLVGSRLRSRAQGTPLRRADALGGSLLSGIALVMATWFLAFNLIEGPFPMIARGLRSSRIVQTLEATLPAPPSLVDRANELLPLLGLADGSVDLPGQPAPPVEPPTRAQLAAATRAAERSTVEVVGDGCADGSVNQGSGFVVGPGVVVTNAHVVAGTHSQWVQLGADSLAAAVVGFDTELDIAVLTVPGSTSSLSGCSRATPSVAPSGRSSDSRGEGRCRPMRRPCSRCSNRSAPTSTDAGGSAGASTSCRPGSIEATAVVPSSSQSGEVAGLVFASSADRDGIGYAIVSDEVAPVVDRAKAATGAVDTGPCLA